MVTALCHKLQIRVVGLGYDHQLREKKKLYRNSFTMI